jgi:hypothetical protein
MPTLPRCQIVPIADHQVAFLIDGQDRLRWHFGSAYPRPFFFPLTGPAGSPLTRMGHPGAPDHDHHQSIWFAHHKVLGIDFWGYRSQAVIRQQQWLAYSDGDEEAAMAVLLGWYDGHDPRELLRQELIASLRPGDGGEVYLELQSTFRPVAESLEFGQTNFGFLAVRVAKGLSEYFGGGRLTNSEGATGEPAIFGRPARWMDYSGSVPAAERGKTPVIEGITYFDHPANPRYPTPWHVREDGWMGAAVCLAASLVTTREKPLVLRYLLHAHAGPLDAARADEAARRFSSTAPYSVRKSSQKHIQFEIARG